MSLPEIATEQVIPAPTYLPDLEIGLVGALEIVIPLAEKEAEIFLPAAKMVANMAEVAPPQAHADARRRARLLAAVAVLREFKAGLRPY